MKKYDAIFLDRDGTINLDPGYINSLNNYQFYEYTFEALKNLKKLTDRFCIITNQSGVARGIIDPDDLSIIQDHKIDLKKSLMIGDSFCDIEAAKLCQMESMLVLTGNGSKTKKMTNINPTYFSKNLLEASLFLSDAQ